MILLDGDCWGKLKRAERDIEPLQASRTSTNMPVEIVPMRPADIPSLVDCIQVAFEDDPYFTWAFDTRPGVFNKARNYASLKARCEWGMRNALFYVAKDTDSEDPERVVGVSMWIKPRRSDAPQSWSEWVDDYVLWFRQGVNILWYRGWGGLRLNRYWIWQREHTAAQNEIWTDPEGYYFVNIVVVRPGLQGKGIGRRLFEVVTKMADREGRKCYLESSRDKPNTTIYEKMGFKLAKKMVCDDAGEVCELFCMVREPQSTA